MSEKTGKNQKIEELFSRRIEQAFPSREEAIKRLEEGKQLKFYLGIDPTGPNIHLGHSIPLLVLKNLYELGHKIILLIGDFTARIGDPSDKESVRQPLSPEQVKENSKTYLEQVYKILPRGSFEVKYNSKWLSRMSFPDISELASHVTVEQIKNRGMFKERDWKWRCPECKKISQSPIIFKDVETYRTTIMKNNKIICPNPKCGKQVDFNREDIFPSEKPIFLHEFLYPLMQGYDSVAMEVDGEIGGDDQMFNMLVGRELEKIYLKKDKLVLTTRLLVDAESGKKMSKSEKGFIAINDQPDEIFGKIMASVPDGMIKTVFELCTEKEQGWINQRQKEIDSGGNPKNFKEELAFELVRMYHGIQAAEKAKENFKEVFSEKQLPEKMPEIENKGDIIQTSIAAGIVESRGEIKRLINQKAVEVDGKAVDNWNKQVKEGSIIKIGPHRFYKVVKNKSKKSN